MTALQEQGVWVFPERLLLQALREAPSPSPGAQQQPLQWRREGLALSPDHSHGLC